MNHSFWFSWWVCLKMIISKGFFNALQYEHLRLWHKRSFIVYESLYILLYCLQLDDYFLNSYLKLGLCPFGTSGWVIRGTLLTMWARKKNKKNKKNFLCSSKVILAKPNIYSSSSVVFPLCSGEKLDLKPTPSSCQACERSRHTHKHTHANKQPCWTLPEATVTDLQWPLLEHR